MDTIGKKLKRLRIQRDLTMREVAAGIQVPLTAYREWEYGRAIRGLTAQRQNVLFSFFP